MKNKLHLSIGFFLVSSIHLAACGATNTARTNTSSSDSATGGGSGGGDSTGGTGGGDSTGGNGGGDSTGGNGGGINTGGIAQTTAPRYTQDNSDIGTSLLFLSGSATSASNTNGDAISCTLADGSSFDQTGLSFQGGTCNINFSGTTSVFGPQTYRIVAHHPNQTDSDAVNVVIDIEKPVDPTATPVLAYVGASGGNTLTFKDTDTIGTKFVANNITNFQKCVAVPQDGAPILPSPGIGFDTTNCTVTLLAFPSTSVDLKYNIYGAYGTDAASKTSPTNLQFTIHLPGVAPVKSALNLSYSLSNGTPISVFGSGVDASSNIDFNAKLIPDTSVPIKYSGLNINTFKPSLTGGNQGETISSCKALDPAPNKNYIGFDTTDCTLYFLRDFIGSSTDQEKTTFTVTGNTSSGRTATLKVTVTLSKAS